MTAILRFLFPTKSSEHTLSLFLLSLRILFGFLFLMHGLQKWINYEQLAQSFPDPLGVGSSLSLTLAIFGEVACSIGFIVGALYRPALIPMIFTMGVAFFVIHGDDPFASRELAFIYLIVFVLMFVMGSGRYAFDRAIALRLPKKRE